MLTVQDKKKLLEFYESAQSGIPALYETLETLVAEKKLSEKQIKIANKFKDKITAFENSLASVTNFDEITENHQKQQQLAQAVSYGIRALNADLTHADLNPKSDPAQVTFFIPEAKVNKLQKPFFQYCMALDVPLLNKKESVADYVARHEAQAQQTSSSTTVTAQPSEPLSMPQVHKPVLVVKPRPDPWVKIQDVIDAIQKKRIDRRGGASDFLAKLFNFFGKPTRLLKKQVSKAFIEKLERLKKNEEGQDVTEIFKENMNKLLDNFSELQKGIEVHRTQAAKDKAIAYLNDKSASPLLPTYDKQKAPKGLLKEDIRNAAVRGMYDRNYTGATGEIREGVARYHKKMKK